MKTDEGTRMSHAKINTFTKSAEQDAKEEASKEMGRKTLGGVTSGRQS